MRILTDGTRLAGQYSLSRRLAQGAGVEVWLARDQRSNSDVALKILCGDAIDNPISRDSLQREWRIGSRLMHANIVRVFEFHDETDGAFFSLQYVGESNIGVVATLGDPIAKLRPLALIVDAIRYAHAKDVVHRDIKASNVLLDSRGAPYLVDFGVSSKDGSNELGTSGTPIAASPQQASGSPAAKSDDIYSLGVLMHELLIGTPPDGAGQPAAMPKDIPEAVSTLLAEMLHVDSGERPNAEQVIERLAVAGITGGAVPATLVAGGVRDELVESRQVRSRTKHQTATRDISVGAVAKPRNKSSASGLSPAIIYAGLAVAVITLLAVVFVLPRVVQNTPSPGDVESQAIPATAATSASTASDELAAEVVDAGSSPGADALGAGTNAATPFNENTAEVSSGSAAEIKAATDEALGDLLSQLERLKYRAVDRWGGQEYLDVLDIYAAGDAAYLDKNYRLAGERYRQASTQLEPFFSRIEQEFDKALAAAEAAFEDENPTDAVRLFDLAVSITPGNRRAEDGFARARNLADVLALVDQAEVFESDLELDAARLAFEKALELDEQWKPASNGLARINEAIRSMSFEQRMTEGFDALASGNFESARAAFNAARKLNPNSGQPGDGLLQVDQEIRLSDIRRLEQVAANQEDAEQWQAAIATYQDVLKIDPDLQFANEGLSRARSRAALHDKLAHYIDDPDTLNDQVAMQTATQLLLDVTRMQPIGPRLTDQKNELSRLLKRAATPLSVRLVSDNMTDVAIYKVGRFGNFSSQEIELRPGRYVAVGSRPGYRDVRVEFRVSPEVEMEPVVVQVEEPI